MARFNADKIYFDELLAGIGSQVNFDDSNNFDADLNTQITGTFEVDFLREDMRAIEILDIDIICDVVIDEDYSSFIDLLQLVPSKFRTSTLLQDYLQEVGTLTGTWLGYINDLLTLMDKYSVSEDYIQKLADLVNLTILYNDTTSLAEKRRQLIQVIEWYKLKGTYGALQYISYLLGINVNIWDLYTNDYVTFIQEPWFVGVEGENPGGLDGSYYKSPHIGFEVLLNKVFGTGITSYLFSSGTYSDFSAYVELARPINVVPHYTLLLSPVTDQTGAVTTVAGNIQTCAVGSWAFNRRYFDNSRNFDNAEFFDYTNIAMYQNITRWKIGTGSKGVPPSPSWVLETVALSGLMYDIRIYTTYVEYEFRVPNTLTITGISELGLFLTTGDICKIGCTFPNIDITPGVTLKVIVTLLR